VQNLAKTGVPENPPNKKKTGKRPNAKIPTVQKGKSGAATGRERTHVKLRPRREVNTGGGLIKEVNSQKKPTMKLVRIYQGKEQSTR